MDGKVRIKLNINGSSVESLVSRKKSLADFIRNELHLTGTKKGCDTGDCGFVWLSLMADQEQVVTCQLIKLMGTTYSQLKELLRVRIYLPYRKPLLNQGQYNVDTVLLVWLSRQMFL